MNPPRMQWVGLTAAALAVVAVPMGLALWGERSGWLPNAASLAMPATAHWTRTISGLLVGMASLAIAAALLRWVPVRHAFGSGWCFVLLAAVLLSVGLAHWFEVLALWMPEQNLLNQAHYLSSLTIGLTAVALFHTLPRVWTWRSSQPAVPTCSSALTPTMGAPGVLPSGPSVSPPPCAAAPIYAGGVSGKTTCAILEEAERASHIRDTFLAMAAHELRTPLQSTLYWAQLLRRTDASPVLVADAAQHIIHNVLVQSRLIGDLLDISRILTGQLRMEWQPNDAVALVRHAVELVQTEAEVRGIRIELHVPDQPVPLLTDACRLEQVVWNLVSNAVHASRDGTRVDVSLMATDQRVQLVVQDQGVGIAPHDLARLFDAFHQGEARAAQHGGLGLGLTITRSIVQQLGGQVAAHSDGVGQGARFSVDLPRQPPPVVTGLNAT